MAMKDILPSVALCLILVGVCLALAGAALYYSAFKEVNYVQTEGRVLSSEIRMSLSNMSTSSSRTSSWQLYVTYEFQVDGERHETDVVGAQRPGSTASLGADPADWLVAMKDSFQQGDTVPVYFALTRPHTAILIKQKGGFPIVMILGFLILAGGVYLRRMI